MAKNASLRTALVQKVVWRVLVLDEATSSRILIPRSRRAVAQDALLFRVAVDGDAAAEQPLGVVGSVELLASREGVADGRPSTACDLGKGVVDKSMLQAAQNYCDVNVKLKTDVERGLPPKLETVVAALSDEQLFWYQLYCSRTTAPLLASRKTIKPKARAAPTKIY